MRIAKFLMATTALSAAAPGLAEIDMGFWSIQSVEIATAAKTITPAAVETTDVDSATLTSSFGQHQVTSSVTDPASLTTSVAKGAVQLSPDPLTPATFGFNNSLSTQVFPNPWGTPSSINVAGQVQTTLNFTTANAVQFQFAGNWVANFGNPATFRRSVTLYQGQAELWSFDTANLGDSLFEQRNLAAGAYRLVFASSYSNFRAQLNAGEFYGDGLMTLTDLGGGSGGVPEPATWGLMILGLGGVGASLRRARAASARLAGENA